MIINLLRRFLSYLALLARINLSKLNVWLRKNFRMQLIPSEVPQTPSGDEIYLDHVGWFVRDMEGVASAMERLGFLLTPFVAQHNADPVGGPPVPAGTGNRCAMLRRGYLEFLSVIPGVNTTLSRQLNVALDRYQGLHLLAFTINDSESAHQRLNLENFLPF